MDPHPPDRIITEPDGPPDRPDRGPRRVGRQTVLAGLGIGGAVVGTPAIAAATRRRAGGLGDDRPDGLVGARQGPRRGSGPESAAGSDGPASFTRIFDDHPPFVDPSDELREALAEIGRPGGMLDAADPLEVGPIRLITEPELSPDNPDNPTHTAGATFMGQFIDHDVTPDAGSRLGRPESTRRSVNLRTARLDLDSVYGGGPAESPELYRTDDPLVFRVESGGRFEDVPRDSDGTAIIADGRNDENLDHLASRPRSCWPTTPWSHGSARPRTGIPMPRA